MSEFSYYESVWIKELQNPISNNFGTISTNDCSEIYQNNPTIYFDIQRLYTKYERYPISITSGFSQIGGLMAFLKISLLLSYIHEKIYEKHLNNKVKIATDRDDIKLEEIKKFVTIENYILLAQGHQMQQQIIEEMRKKIEVMEEKIDFLEQNRSLEEKIKIE